MAAFASVYDFVMSEIPAVDGLVDQAIRESVIRFCERSRLYRYTHPDVPVVANTSTYTLTPQAGAQIAGIIYAEISGIELDQAEEADLDQWLQNWRTTGTGTPLYFFMEKGATNKIRLVPAPQASGATMKLITWQKPTHAATTFPDFIYGDHLHAIVHGAKAWLYGNQTTPWHDPGKFAYHAMACRAETPGPSMASGWASLVE
jgi:hypothetical protein